MIVPVFIAAVWIVPSLRVPKFWFGLSLATILGTTIWLGLDLYEFVDSRGSAQGLPLRVVFVLLSETGKPVLPVILGSFLAGLFSRRFPKVAPTESGSPFAGDVTTTVGAEARQ